MIVFWTWSSCSQPQHKSSTACNLLYSRQLTPSSMKGIIIQCRLLTWFHGNMIILGLDVNCSTYFPDICLLVVRASSSIPLQAVISTRTSLAPWNEAQWLWHWPCAGRHWRVSSNTTSLGLFGSMTRGPCIHRPTTLDVIRLEVPYYAVFLSHKCSHPGTGWQNSTSDTAYIERERGREVLKNQIIIYRVGYRKSGPMIEQTDPG